MTRQKRILACFLSSTFVWSAIPFSALAHTYNKPGPIERTSAQGLGVAALSSGQQLQFALNPTNSLAQTPPLTDPTVLSIARPQIAAPADGMTPKEPADSMDQPVSYSKKPSVSGKQVAKTLSAQAGNPPSNGSSYGALVKTLSGLRSDISNSLTALFDGRRTLTGKVVQPLRLLAVSLALTGHSINAHEPGQVKPEAGSAAVAAAPLKEASAQTALEVPLPSPLRHSRFALFGDALIQDGKGRFTLERKFIVIENGRIQSVSSRRPTHQPIYHTNGVILPGLINLHEHITYAYARHYSDTIFSDRTDKFENRYEWQRDPAYKASSDAHYKRMPKEDPSARLAFELYGEIRQIVGGSTAVADKVSKEAAAPGALARNIFGEFRDGATPMRIQYPIFFLNPAEVKKDPPNFILDDRALEDIRKSEISILHLCEGRKMDATTRHEFELFLKWAKAHPDEARKLVLVHLVGLEPADFKKLADLGINRAIWSPSSNLINYGETMNVRAAVQAGFKIALGTDWYPTGSDSLFDEFRVAREYKQGLSDGQLLAMLLSAPAQMLGTQNQFGRIQPGSLADLVVIPRAKGGLLASILAADVDNLKLVMIGGKPFYGAKSLLTVMVQRVYPAPGRADASFSFDPESVKSAVEERVKDKVVPLVPLGERMPPLGLKKPAPPNPAANSASLRVPKKKPSIWRVSFHPIWRRLLRF